MMDRNLYAVAVLVTKLPPETRLHTDPPSGAITYRVQEAEPYEGDLSPEHVLMALSTIADSEAEAIEKGLKGAREAYPESEGWNFFNASARIALETTTFAQVMRGKLSARFLSSDERQIMQAVLLDLIVPEGVTND